MTADIRGQAALITGASRGIGRACALELARAGCRLFLTARDTDKLAGVAAECAALGAECHICAADLARTVECKRVVLECVAQLAGLNILVNNAGVYHGGSSCTADLAKWDEMLDVNLRNVIHLTRHALPHIKAGLAQYGRGAVVFVASMSGKRTYAGGAGYCATKFGVVGFASGLWDDVAHLGIKVSALCPGWVNTDMAADSGLDTAQMIQPADVARLCRLVAEWPDESCPRELLVAPQRPLDPGATTA